MGSTEFTANANPGYEFVNWTINGVTGNTTNPLTLNIQSATTLVANFALITYQVTVSSSPALGGSVSPASSQYVGSTEFTANANPGYEFVNWTINGVTGNTTNPLTLNIQSATTLVANFALITYQVTVSSSPALGGSVSPASSQYVGSTEFTANANPGYEFVNWTINGVTGNTTNPLTLNIQSATTLVANFALITYQVTVSSSPALGGSVSPASRNDRHQVRLRQPCPEAEHLQHQEPVGPSARHQRRRGTYSLAVGDPRRPDSADDQSRQSRPGLRSLTTRPTRPARGTSRWPCPTVSASVATTGR